MGLFGFGEDPSIARAEMSPEFAGGFGRGQAYAYEELGGARRTGEEQRRLAEMLRAQAEGRGPSLAQMQFAQALQQAQAATQAQLASARGLSPAQAQQLAMQQQQAARQQAAGQSAALRLQEQMAAQANLGTALAQERQGGILAASTAGGLGMQAGQLGVTQQQMEQQRLIKEQELKREQQAAAEKGITDLAQTAAKLAFAKSKGGEIKGRAAYSGDTRSNDTIPAMLSPGEIVLPRSVAQSPDAPEKAKDFVSAIKSKKKPTPKDYVAALGRMQELEARLNAIETLMDLEAEGKE
jgi:hypothetical protein